MSEADTSARKSTVTIWVVTIVAACVIYLAAYPWVFCMAFQQAFAHAMKTTGTGSANTGAWYVKLGYPYFYLAEAPPFEKPLKGYLGWCMERWNERERKKKSEK